MAMEEFKESLCNNILIPVPKNYGEVISKSRGKQGLIQEEISERLLMRGRSAISEYENQSTTITIHTWSLLAIALNFHPNLPEGSFYDKPLVFEASPEPKEGYAAFLNEALKDKRVSKRALCRHAKISDRKLTSYLDGSAKPTARQWVAMQLALNHYVCGFDIAEILKAERVRKGWSQTDIAEITGLSAQSISNYETRKSIPGNHVWSLLMLAYDIHPNYHLVKKEFTGDDDVYMKIVDALPNANSLNR